MKKRKRMQLALLINMGLLAAVIVFLLIVWGRSGEEAVDPKEERETVSYVIQEPLQENDEVTQTAEAEDSSVPRQEGTAVEMEQLTEVEESTNGEETAEETPSKPLTPIAVLELEAGRLSGQEIQVLWSDSNNAFVKKYIVKKRKASEQNAEWEVVQEVESDGIVRESNIVIIDKLQDTKPQQYEYRVDIEVADPNTYLPKEGATALASNVLICIDPGHYKGGNLVSGEDSYGYAEGDFTLKLAKELKRILLEEYGIDAYMTREQESITIQGYTDAKLDRGHISLRGEYAAERDSNLFVSIHTNANNENANGYETCMQPIAINKPIVLINTVGCASESAIRAANGIGTGLAQVSYQLGIATVGEFETVEQGNISEWTAQKNDSLDTKGSVYCRLGENGDYYGVLRGASNVEKPGIIIEHGFHTVAEVRREAMEGDLETLWAQADAYGIAYGFGFVADILP